MLKYNTQKTKLKLFGSFFPVDDSLTMRTLRQIITTLEFIIKLWRNIQITPLADRVVDRSDSKPFSLLFDYPVSFYNMKIVIFLLVILLLILQYQMWFSRSGIVPTIHLKHAVAQQTKENQKLIKRNEQLLKNIQALKHSHDSVKTLAREELGMVKKGEVYYQFVHDTFGE